MHSEALLDNGLFVRLDVGDPRETNASFDADVANQARLAAHLLIYDRVVIPTTDFGIIPILVSWLGLKRFEAALAEGRLRFLRRYGVLAYTWEGTGGINTIVIREGQGTPKRMEWWGETMWRDTDVALEQQLKYGAPLVSSKERKRLFRSVMERSKNVEHENEFFIRNVVDETFTDLTGHELSTTLQRLNGGAAPRDLTNLLGGQETRVLRKSGEVRDPVDLVLRVAEINMEVVMSTHTDGADLYTSEGAEQLLASKLARAGVDRSALRGFARLMDLNSMPDIGALMKAGLLSSRQIFDLCQRPVARDFRRWMREEDAPDPEELARRFVTALRMEQEANNVPLKALRMGITAAVDTIAPGFGTAGDVMAKALGATDSLFVDKWTSGYSPRLFFDELAKIQMGR